MYGRRIPQRGALAAGVAFGGAGTVKPWPDLQCEQLKLTKEKGGPDVWKADMKLTYYY